MQHLNRIAPRVQPARRLRLAALESLAPAPAATVVPFAVGIARPARPARRRAPRGGVEVAGRRYRGGVFLPATDAAVNPRDSWPDWTDERWTVAGEPAPGIDLSTFAAPEPRTAAFAIHGFRYAAREIPAGECGSVAFEVHRPDTNHTYHVLRDGYGLVKCDCPDYLFRHDGTGGMCKHGQKLVELGLVASPSPIASTLGRREFITPYVSVLRNATPDRFDYPAARPRRFEPSPEDMAEAAQLLAEVAGAR